jgi:glycosyltransferase involved in cell wall biosynthesis
MPSKLYGYMAAGKPIIAVASEGSEVARMVKAYGMGAVAENGEDLVEAIMKLYREPDLRARMGSSARRAFLENFDRPLATGRFKTLMEGVMSRRVESRQKTVRGESVGREG